nr:hypothetical protein Iba_chr08aCG1240 [Ipomoea batatas]
MNAADVVVVADSVLYAGSRYLTHDLVDRCWNGNGDNWTIQRFLNLNGSQDEGYPDSERRSLARKIRFSRWWFEPSESRMGHLMQLESVDITIEELSSIGHDGTKREKPESNLPLRAGRIVGLFAFIVLFPHLQLGLHFLVLLCCIYRVGELIFYSLHHPRSSRCYLVLRCLIKITLVIFGRCVELSKGISRTTNSITTCRGVRQLCFFRVLVLLLVITVIKSPVEICVRFLKDASIGEQSGMARSSIYRNCRRFLPFCLALWRGSVGILRAIALASSRQMRWCGTVVVVSLLLSHERQRRRVLPFANLVVNRAFHA